MGMVEGKMDIIFFNFWIYNVINSFLSIDVTAALEVHFYLRFFFSLYFYLGFKFYLLKK